MSYLLETDDLTYLFGPYIGANLLTAVSYIPCVLLWKRINQLWFILIIVNSNVIPVSIVYIINSPFVYFALNSSKNTGLCFCSWVYDKERKG
jgi:hypothetical protein